MARLFTLTVTMDNDAFNDGMGGREELAEILTDTVSHLSDSDERYLYDSNGNKVGKWSVTETEN